MSDLASAPGSVSLSQVFCRRNEQMFGQFQYRTISPDNDGQSNDRQNDEGQNDEGI